MTGCGAGRDREPHLEDQEAPRRAGERQAGEQTGGPTDHQAAQGRGREAGSRNRMAGIEKARHRMRALHAVL